MPGRATEGEGVEFDRGLARFVVADNLRTGAATKAVQVLEILVELGRWD